MTISFNFPPPQGWVCPRCSRVMSPSTICMCGFSQPLDFASTQNEVLDPKDYTLEQWVKLWQREHDKPKASVTFEWEGDYTTSSETYPLIDTTNTHTENSTGDE